MLLFLQCLERCLGKDKVSQSEIITDLIFSFCSKVSDFLHAVLNKYYSMNIAVLFCSFT